MHSILRKTKELYLEDEFSYRCFSFGVRKAAPFLLTDHSRVTRHAVYLMFLTRKRPPLHKPHHFIYYLVASCNTSYSKTRWHTSSREVCTTLFHLNILISSDFLDRWVRSVLRAELHIACYPDLLLTFFLILDARNASLLIR